LSHELQRIPSLLALLLLTSLLLPGCVLTKLPPISAEGAAFQPLSSELKLW